MAAGNAFEPLVVQAKFPVAEANQYATALQGTGVAAQQMGVAQDNLNAKSAISGVANEKVSQSLLQEKVAAAQAGIALDAKAIAEANAARAAGVHNIANTELEKSFSHTKREMREFAQIGEHLTGVHTGLSGVIRIAMNPAFLAMGAAALIVGKIMEHHKKVQEEVTKAVESSVKWVEAYSKALSDSKDKLIAFDAFQQQIIKTGHELGQLKLEEEIKHQAVAVEDATKKWHAAVGALRAWTEGVKDDASVMHGHTEIIKQGEEKLRFATATMEAAKLRQEELSRALKAGFQTVDEYESSLRHWSDTATEAYNLTHKITPATQKHAEEVRKLTEEYERGAFSVEVFNKRLADLQLIFNAAHEKELGASRKHDATVLNERKAFWDARTKMDAENQPKGLARELAIAQAEEKAEEDKARKLFGKGKELAAALLAIRTEFNQKMRVLVTADTNAQIKEGERAAAQLLKDAKDIDAALLSERKKKQTFYNQLTVMEGKYRLTKLQHRLADQMANEAAMREEAIATFTNKAELEAALTALTKAGAAERIRITQEEAAAERKVMINRLLSQASQLARMFGNNKNAAKAGAMVDIARGIMADVALGWPMMLPAMIFTAAIGDQTIRKIDSAPPPTQGQGHDGLIFPRSGSYLMNVNAGEGIMKNSSMDAINQMMSNIGKATGKRGGKSAGSGTVMNFNAPMYANENHAVEYARRVEKVNARRNVSAG